jgi:hypothetical protein
MILSPVTIEIFWGGNQNQEIEKLEKIKNQKKE